MKKVIKTTKHEQVREYLEKKKKISSWDAISKFGASRLSAIIYNLRNEGYDILTENVQETDRNGRNCNFALYHLLSKPKTGSTKQSKAVYS